jgi:hypothetical protein
MISDRPYSAAISHQAAVDELLRERGTQFDPDLVDVFVSLVGDGTRPSVVSHHLAVAPAPRGKNVRTRAKASNGAKPSSASTGSNASKGLIGSNGSNGSSGAHSPAAVPARKRTAAGTRDS